MDSKADLTCLLNLVQVQKNYVSDIMEKKNITSIVYMQAKGSYSAYCTVETYISNLMSQKSNEKKEEVENYERID